jgi:hypothetical protein
MRLALRNAQHDARSDVPGQPDAYVIVRCADPGANAGLRAGADYLVLRRFVQDC